MKPEQLHVILLARAVAPWHGVGGLERHVSDMTWHLLRRGVRVTLVTPPPSVRQDADAETLPLLDAAVAAMVAG